MYLDENFLLKAIPCAHIIQGNFPQNITFSIDSRSIQHNELFFALPGKHVDGHTFAIEAYQKCAGIIISHNQQEIINKIKDTTQKIIITVPDTYQALIALSKLWREQFSYPVIAITGSVGKTSTKNILSHILKYNNIEHSASHGNQNTIIGVSLNISRMKATDKAAIFEIGISRCGEMIRIAQHLKPTIGLITIIGHSHMAGLGTIQQIAFEKQSLFSQFTETNIGIINGDSSLLTTCKFTHPIIKFGIKTKNQIQARKIKIIDNKIQFTMRIYNHDTIITLPTNHKGMLNNTLAAATIAHTLNIDIKNITNAITTPCITKDRFEICIMKNNRGTIINDTYNASPESMKCALLSLDQIKTNNDKIAILGDMLEMGDRTLFWHRQIGRFLKKTPSIKQLILVGTHVHAILQTAPEWIKSYLVPSWQEAANIINQYQKSQIMLLVKGSNGMQLNKLVEQFIEKQ